MTEHQRQPLPLEGTTVSAIEQVIGEKLEVFLVRSREGGWSTTQMHDHLRNVTGIQFSKRQLQRWLDALDINFTKIESGRQRWADGLMRGVPQKVRRTMVRTQVTGSRVEELIRWELKGDLETRNDYEVLVGFTNWSILPDLEVDVPFILIRRQDQRVFKFALEIDGAHFHPDDTHWEKKRQLLLQAGWIPLRLTVDRDFSRHAYQVYKKDNIRSAIDLSSLMTQVDNVLTQAKPTANSAQ